MQINVRGAQVRPAQTRQDTSKLQDIQRKAQDTQALIGVAKAGIEMFSSFDDQKKRKAAKAKSGEIEVWEKTGRVDDLKRAAREGTKAAKGIDQPLSAKQTPFQQYSKVKPSFESKGVDLSGDSDFDDQISTINTIHQEETRRVFESAYDGALIGDAFTSMPEDLKGLPEEIAYATSHFKSSTDKFFNADDSEESFKDMLGKYITAQSQFVNGQDIIDYNGDYIQEMLDQSVMLDPLARRQMADNYYRAFTNTVIEDAGSFAFKYLDVSDSQKLVYDKYLNNSLVSDDQRLKLKGMVHRFDELSTLFEDTNFDPRSIPGNLKLFQVGGEYAESYIAEMNRRVMEVPGLSVEDKKGKLIQLLDGRVPLPEQYTMLAIQTGALPEGARFVNPSMGAGGGSGSGGGKTAKANWRSVTAEDNTSETDTAFREKVIADIFAVIYPGDDLDVNAFEKSHIDINRFIENTFDMPGTYLYDKPDAPLDAASWERQLDSLVRNGMRIVKTKDGFDVIRFDPLGLMGTDNKGRIAEIIQQLQTEKGIGRGEWELIAPESTNGSYVLFDNATGKTVDSKSGNVYNRFLGLAMGEAVDETPGLANDMKDAISDDTSTEQVGITPPSSPVQEGDDADRPMTPSERSEFQAALDELGIFYTLTPDGAIELVADQESFVAIAEAEGWSDEQRAENAADFATVGTGALASATFISTMKAIDVANRMTTLKAFERNLTRAMSSGDPRWLEKQARRLLPDFNMGDLMDSARSNLGGQASERAVLQEYRRLLGESIRSVPDHLNRLRSASRREALRGFLNVAKRGGTNIAKGAWWTSKKIAQGSIFLGVKTPWALGSFLLKDLKNPYWWARQGIGQSITYGVNYYNVSQHGMTTEQIADEIARRVGMPEVTPTDKLYGFLGEGFGAFIGDGEYPEVPDMSGWEWTEAVVKAGLDNTILFASGWYTGVYKDSDTLDAYGRGLFQAGRQTIFGIGDTPLSFNGSRREESNLVSAHTKAQRVVEDVGFPSSWGSWWQYNPDGEQILQGRAQVESLVLSRETSATIPVEVFDRLSTLYEEEGSLLLPDVREHSRLLSSQEERALSSMKELGMDTDRLPKNREAFSPGEAPVSRDAYAGIVKYLTDAASEPDGTFMISRNDAQLALATMTQKAGTDVTNMSRIAREFFEVGTYKDAQPVLDRLDLSDERIEGYVFQFNTWKNATGKHANLLPGDTIPNDDKAAYLQWVGRGMPFVVGSGDDLKISYPIDPDANAALGFFSDDEYLVYNGAFYNEQDNTVAFRMSVPDDMSRFLAYMDVQQIQPQNPVEMQQAYVDFQDFSRAVEESKAFSQNETLPRNHFNDILDVEDQIAERVGAVEESFMDHWLSTKELFEAERYIPYDRSSKSIDESWGKRFTANAKGELEAMVGGQGWPVMYKDTPDTPLWDLPTDSPSALRGKLNKHIEYLNGKIELEINRSVEPGRGRSVPKAIKKMQDTVRILRQLETRSYLYEQEVSPPSRYRKPTSASLYNRWAPYMFGGE